MEKQNNKKLDNKSLILIAIKKHKLGLLIVILLCTLSTTLAWFTYNTQVEMQAFSNKVKAWKIDVSSIDEEENKILIDLEELYPGRTSIIYDSSDDCDEDNHCITITNSGEMDGSISLIFDSIVLFGEEEDESNYTISKKTVGDGEEYVINGYAFNLKFVVVDKIVYKEGSATGTSETRLYYELEWKYEKEQADFDEECEDSSDTYCESLEKYIDYYDTIDTALGERSYEYHKTKEEGDKDLSISLRINVSEINPTP